MPLPGDFNLVEVYGKYALLDGTAAQGTVTFSASARLLSAATKTTILPKPITGKLDATGALKGADGEAALQVPATDDPDITPGGWGYTVTEAFGNYTRTYPLLVPLGGGAIDLTIVAPVEAPPSPGVIRVLTVNDIGPDAAGNVDLGPGSGGGTVPDATAETKGVLRLAGDLAGTADTPTVPGLAGKYVKPGPGIPFTDLAVPVQTSLNDADTAVQPADLATVATTGAYTDLSGKPTIPTQHSDLTGLVPQSALPAVALTDFLGNIASQAAMLALTGQRGDWCFRTDTGTDWQLVADTPAVLGSWQEHHYPASPVSSVAGRTGAVTLSKTDVGLPNVDNTADTAKPVSTAQQTALDGKAAVVHNHAAADLVSGVLDIARIPTGTSGTTVPLGNDPRFSDARTPSAGDAYTRVTVASWEAARPTPYFIAHRGSGDVVPECSLEAFEYAVQAGAQVLEVSVVQTLDAQLVVNHDLTFDRTSNMSGTIAAFPSSVLRSVRIDKMTQLGPAWCDTKAPRPVLFEEVLRRFGGRVVMCCEAKNDAAYPAMVAMIERYGLKASTIIKAFYTSARLATAQAAGYKTFSYIGLSTDVTAPNVATAVVHADYLVIPAYTADDNTRIDTTSIATAVAGGKPVWAYPVHRRSDAAYLVANGVSGVVTASYGYVSGTGARAVTDTWASGAVAPGEVVFAPSGTSFTPVWTSPNILSLGKSAQQHFVSLGAVPTPAGTYSVDFDARWDVLPADTSTNLTLAVGQADDGYYQHQLASSPNGYHAIFRPSGLVQLYTHVAGSGTQLGSQSVAAAVAGTWMHFKLTVTPTTVTWTRTDVGTPNSVSVTNNTYRGAYLHIGRSSTDGQLSLRNLVIS